MPGDHPDRIKNLGEASGRIGWKPGQSGNPGGRTKAYMAARRIAAELVAERTDGGRKIIEFAANVLDNCNGPEVDGKWDSKSRRWAADFLADRLWGKAPLTVEVKSEDSAVAANVRTMTRDQLLRIAAGETDGDAGSGVH